MAQRSPDFVPLVMIGRSGADVIADATVTGGIIEPLISLFEDSTISGTDGGALGTTIDPSVDFGTAIFSVALASFNESRGLIDADLTIGVQLELSFGTSDRTELVKITHERLNRRTKLRSPNIVFGSLTTRELSR